jgi:hypothetical protein
MVKKIALAFGTLALAAASAANSYHVTLYQPTVVNGTELKPGDYKLEVRADKAVLTQGKTSTEAGVKVESADSKFRTTSFRYLGNEIQEIHIGGTNTKLVFEKGAADSSARGQ